MSEIPTVETTEVLELSPLVEALLAPVSGENPCGDDIKYDDDFQELKAEVDLLGSGTGGVDFDRIVTLATKILTDKSKDLVSVGYLALGLSRTKGVEGMAEGVVAAQMLVERYWEKLYPAKAVRRRNSLQFLADRLKEWMLLQPRPKESDRVPLELAREALKGLQTFTMKALEYKAPALSGLMAALNEAIKRLPKPKPVEQPPAETSQTAAGESAETEAPVSSSGTPESSRVKPEKIGSSTDAVRQVIRSAAFLRSEDATNPVPYRLLRSVRWAAIKEKPPNEGGKTLIKPPPQPRCQAFVGLLEKGDPAKLVEEAEASFQQAPFYFWLDLQRLMVTALEQLGASYKAVRQAVTAACAELVERLPGLTALTFSDGMPFADLPTQEWLATLGTAGGTDARVGTSRKQGSAGELEATMQVARQTLGSGDLSGALALLQSAPAGYDDSGQIRFRRRLYQATLCAKGGQPEVARAMLEDLNETVARHALDMWDPTLVLEMWENQYQAYVALAKKQTGPRKATYLEAAFQTLDKISQCDAARAVKVLNKAK